MDKTSKELTRIALDANIALQIALTEKAHVFEAHLEEIDRLLVRISAQVGYRNVAHTSTLGNAAS
jgi:hypothetical protein